MHLLDSVAWMETTTVVDDVVVDGKPRERMDLEILINLCCHWLATGRRKKEEKRGGGDHEVEKN